MNEHLSERFGRGSSIHLTQSTPQSTARPSMNLNPSIRKYVNASNQPVDISHWTSFPEIPAALEVFDKGRKDHEQTLEIGENIIVGPYTSKEDYLERHYSLLREDAVAPLRNVVSELQVYPYLKEKDSANNALIYERVHLTGIILASQGIAARLTVSLKRLGKKVNWEQSKRLLTGTVIALTPAKDNFKSVCRVAVVAARPLAGLQQNPPEVDIYFGDPDEFEIDPQEEWLMVESSNGYFESSRHILRGLQMLAKEKFPFAEHIVKLNRDIEAPKYLQEQPLKDLSSLYPEESKDVQNVDILRDWPGLQCGLDESQIAALRRILSRRLAIVQGPPGTGKTYVSVVALRLLIENLGPDDPPIIVAAHTNHAVDQLLRHVSAFEPEFIRLGGMTTDTEIIKPRTLFEVKQSVRQSNVSGGAKIPAMNKLKQLQKEITLLLHPLTEGKEILPSSLFLKYGIISDVQYDSLAKGAKEWVRAGEHMGGDMAMWLGDERIEANRRTMPEDFDIEIEEIDLEFEQLKEIEAENRMIDDEDFESLKGARVIFNEPWTGRKAIGVSMHTVLAELKKRDLWEIHEEYRGPVYIYLQQQVKQVIQRKFREKAREYAAAVQEAKIGRWEVDTNYLKQAKIIGMTTTGLSKNRGLLQSLNPKVVLIEEAAETLEAPVSVACFKTLEHLILVGDHQQLRGSCNDEELAGAPFWLAVSMFERLVRNKVDFTQLKRQRRMIPEIRRALKPIYDDLEDHTAVHEHPPVPGMGGVNTFFFSHQFKESTDRYHSKTNHEEADMVVNLFEYLTQNGMMNNDITVLTFYNGQRKLILRKLRERRNTQERFKVVTVDSYQGEENRVVLLSLVRCNEFRNIGFLGVENRICVALSRAQRGFYIFGDAINLCKSSMLWWEVVQVMAQNPTRVGFHLPLICKNHNNKTYVKEPQEFRGLSGGCQRRCEEKLACSHDCTMNCHPFSHDIVECKARCNRLLKCGHPCTQLCYLDCKSNCDCVKSPPKRENIANNYAKAVTGSPTKNKKPSGSPKNNWSSAQNGSPQRIPRSGSWQQGSRDLSQESKPYRDFAGGGYVQADKDLAGLAAHQAAEARKKKLDMDNFEKLFGKQLAVTKKDTKGETDEMRLVRQTDGGTRGVWEGTYSPPKSQDKGPSKEDEVSLIDL